MTADRIPCHKVPFCPGCGTYYAVHGQHRADCTATEETRNRLHLEDPNPLRNNNTDNSRQLAGPAPKYPTMETCAPAHR
jgi:hypothetical protein